MFRFIWTLSVRTRDFLLRYMPSNRLLAAIRTRRGLKWGFPAMLVAAPYILVATICSDLAADGGPGWLHLIVLWGCWNALKFIVMGPISVALLIRVRIREAEIRLDQRREARVDVVRQHGFGQHRQVLPCRAVAQLGVHAEAHLRQHVLGAR